MDIRKIPANIAFKSILPKLGKCHYEYGTNIFFGGAIFPKIKLLNLICSVLIRFSNEFLPILHFCFVRMEQRTSDCLRQSTSAEFVFCKPDSEKRMNHNRNGQKRTNRSPPENFSKLIVGGVGRTVFVVKHNCRLHWPGFSANRE